ncbi:MAG: type III-A CRISPR-associated RAMP protein Csm3 [Desulfurococcaceae archaeon]|nr:type III-A CRISPR-associated RAMP protein Csm3 [Desulfurococcaceae archaeon]
MSTPKYFQRQLKGFVIFDIEFENRTGLLIRMPIQAQAYRIGGGDTYPMVTRRHYSGIGLLEVPYVPGSSFKGRMRGLLELALNKKFYTTDQRIWQHVRSLSAMSLDDFVDDVLNRCVIDELFGYAAAQYKQIAERVGHEHKSVDVDKIFNMLAITRLIIDDFFPTEDYVKQIGAKSVADFLEEKSENRIDRITSAADPRDIVRVKPGVRFGGRITLLLFDNDADMIEKYLTTLATGLKLIEETYLGASGSRGYGRVKFSKIAVAVEKVQNMDGAPKLVEVPTIRKTYSNVSEFESDVKSLANAIKSAIFS